MLENRGADGVNPSTRTGEDPAQQAGRKQRR